MPFDGVGPHGHRGEVNSLRIFGVFHTSNSFRV